ncbi:hypothetical protein BD31_I0731 [Candidatus Nitrosopumilus salaria BD31]|uniref:Uncharacterized protein n=1 Tax=Candidatus Nitrosopumilus salarius BD31 TaxID=859350 RepID=I3D193_9ARCH|nr:hypothetical protein [Candidatus Nitrosopumilus salaria]EIJ65486.1 hypothetical protein BD31_I0731 [Candidatus Nitrosopumilus salaria BD31]
MPNENLEFATLTEIFEKNIKQIMNNKESFLPLFIKNFSDGHREYTNYIEQVFRIMRTAEENSNIKPDKKVMKLCEEYVNEFSKIYLSHIDMSKNTLVNHLETRLSFMTTWNEQMRKFADSVQK